MTGGIGAGRPARVVLVGAHGHGKWHLANLARLAGLGIAELVGVCDPVPVSDVPWSPELDPLIGRVDPDVVLIATPIHTHVDLALTALRAGRAVLLEKPPAPTFSEFARLSAAVEESGVPCQVGFQSLGSAAVDAVREIVASGRIGTVRGVGGAGTWIRTAAYYGRASWAGRRRLGDVPVVDGALTNPFAHLVATALAIDGGSVADVSPELYHAHPIEADDTAAIRIRTSHGTPVTLAVTLCATHHRTPYLVVHGSAGRLTLHYTEDLVEVAGEQHRYDRVDLLTDLVAHLRDRARPLRVPLASTAGFMRVLDAVRRAPEPVAIDPEWIRESGTGPETRREVVGVDDAVLAAAETLRTFTEQEVPWATTGR
ncbi:Gfo/Idh/MocA family protein [Cryptosporangium aurantiacum]|uniref:Predicted dehydrogenase n=1 Tax=Cryptosporangium aurantiacum TaxID=134849 RepID=A0A1M7RNP0_9ACTN|nr:Gfo/Idh/MocA family oxidoreductase [Cryptosporangium aurantiacum]SHN47770.1 Predicted dehydrogenase [Cryptosporangium aurantiacum]